MKAICYLRIARRGQRFNFAATGRPSPNPLTDNGGNPLPTVQLKLVLELPDDAFSGVLATLAAGVPAEAIKDVAMEVVEP